MAERKMLTNLNMNGQTILNFKADPRVADPTGGDLYEGRAWYNTTSHKAKFYDGSSVQTVATVADIGAIGQFQGAYDASNAAAFPTALDSSDIRPGDFWRVSVGGELTGIIGADVVAPGDLIFATVDGADSWNEFMAVQVNIDLPSGLVVGVVVGNVDLVANTPATVSHGLTTVNGVQVFDSTGDEIGVLVNVTGNTVTLTSNVSVDDLVVRVIGA